MRALEVGSRQQKRTANLSDDPMNLDRLDDESNEGLFLLRGKLVRFDERVNNEAVTTNNCVMMA